MLSADRIIVCYCHDVIDGGRLGGQRVGPSDGKS